MTTLAAGSSVTVVLRDTGQCTVTTSGGFADVAETVGGTTTNHAFGPRPKRRVFGPYSEGATIVITNASAVLDYDSPYGNLVTFDEATQSLVSGDRKLLSAELTKNFIGTRILSAYPQDATGFAQGGNPYTWAVQMALPHDFVAVRLVFVNGLAIANNGVTAAASTGGTASDRLNNSGTWVAATFAGAASIDIPARASAADPSVAVSDWIPLVSTARADGGTYRLVYVRAATPGANANVQLLGFALGTSGWNSKADGLIWTPRYQQGDFVASPTGMTASSDPQSSPIAGIQYISKTGILNYIAFGDSITQSKQTTIPGESWAYRAIRDAGYTMGNFGSDGQTTAQYLTRAERVIPALRPTHAFYPIFSPNDGTPTAIKQGEAFSRALRFVELCRQYGVVPILWTGLPKTTDVTNATASYTSGQDDFRKELNTAFLSIGVTVMDMATAMSDTTALGTASKWASASYLYDGTHPNDAGHEIMKAVAALAIANY